MEQKILAVVAGREIQESEFEKFLQNVPREQQAYLSNPQFRQQCLDQFVALHMFAELGGEMKLEETKEYQEMVENAKRDILAQMAMREVMKDAVVTEDDIKNFYEEHKQQFTKGETVRAKHILTDSKENVMKFSQRSRMEKHLLKKLQNRTPAVHLVQKAETLENLEKDRWSKSLRRLPLQQRSVRSWGRFRHSSDII